MNAVVNTLVIGKKFINVKVWVTNIKVSVGFLHCVSPLLKFLQLHIVYKFVNIGISGV